MRLLRALRREPVDRTPIWLMRQAGRYQEEYRRIRERRSLLEICDSAELAAEVTLIPIRLFPALDAAIVFSDILLPLRSMGARVEFTRGEGPSIEADIHALKPFDSDSLPAVAGALRIVKRELAGRAALIGFAGGPFTLASYVIEGGASRNYERTKMAMRGPAWAPLMTLLTDAVIAHLKRQSEAGADAVQVFDSWAGTLGPEDYREFALPWSRRVFEALRGVPTIHFSTGTAGILDLIAQAGGDAIGVDWRVPLDAAWARLPDRAIQGNLDPTALFGPRDAMFRRADDILARAANRPGHIFNLGHGVLPGTPAENVGELIEHVHARSVR